MLIAVSGAHGVGKSTLLNELAMLDYNVDNFKVSRSVQKKMGYASLAEALTSYNLMKGFQEVIIQEKFEHDNRLSSRSSLNDKIFVERSFFDILIYAELWNEKLNTNESNPDDWLEGFRIACLEWQKIYDRLIIIQTNSDIPFEKDKERGDAESQQQFNDRLVELCEFSNIPYLIIKESNLQKRVNETINFVEK